MTVVGWWIDKDTAEALDVAYNHGIDWVDYALEGMVKTSAPREELERIADVLSMAPEELGEENYERVSEKAYDLAREHYIEVRAEHGGDIDALVDSEKDADVLRRWLRNKPEHWNNNILVEWIDGHYDGSISEFIKKRIAA